jgi:hypothetical protein
MTDAGGKQEVRLNPGALPAAVCRCWPDRDPEPSTGWLARFAFDRAVYQIEA